jgi:hypothetical protein
MKTQMYRNLVNMGGKTDIAIRIETEKPGDMQLKRRIKLLFSILGLQLFVIGCATTYSVVSTDKDVTADFTKYKTYAWLPDKDNSNLNNPIMRNNIKNYFTHEFVDNYGLTANTDMPDVLMEVTVTVANKIEEHSVPTTVPTTVPTPVPNYSYGNYYNTNTPNYSYGYPYPNNPYPQNPYSRHLYYSPQPNPYNYNGYYSGYRYQTTYIKHQHQYTESNITINVIDNKRNELVWTVTAQTDIYDNDSKNVQDDIHPAVTKMLEYFPIKKQ